MCDSCYFPFASNAIRTPRFPPMVSSGGGVNNVTLPGTQERYFYSNDGSLQPQTGRVSYLFQCSTPTISSDTCVSRGTLNQPMPGWRRGQPITGQPITGQPVMEQPDEVSIQPVPSEEQEDQSPNENIQIQPIYEEPIAEQPVQIQPITEESQTNPTIRSKKPPRYSYSR